MLRVKIIIPHITNEHMFGFQLLQFRDEVSAKLQRMLLKTFILDDIQHSIPNSARHRVTTILKPNKKIRQAIRKYLKNMAVIGMGGGVQTRRANSQGVSG